MTRPLAGHLNFGSEPVSSAVLAVSVAGGVSATGVKTLALGVGSALGGEGAGVACATPGTGLDLMADVRTPGITRRSPTLRRAVTGIWLASANSLTRLPYRREILLRVSPRATTCTAALPAALTAATGAVFAGDAGAWTA